MKSKVRIERRYDEAEIRVYKDEVFDEVSGFAAMLIDKWGLVAAMPDGEDSAGRSRLRLPTPTELTDRAFAIAEALFAKAEATGHIVKLPDLNELNAVYDEKRAANLVRREMSAEATT